MIIDSHVHYSAPKYEGEFSCAAAAGESLQLQHHTRDSLLSSLSTRGIRAVVEIPIELASNQRVQDFCHRYPFAYGAAGVHPTRVKAEDWSQRRKLWIYAEDPSVRAIGETGLDFHEPAEQHRLNQIRWFLFQIHVAYRKNLPLVLHIRQAHRTALTVLTCCRPWIHGGVVHCFSGDWPLARAYCVKLGFSLGIGGTLLQDNDRGKQLRETIRHVPLDRILLETDSPYVLPDLKGCCSRSASRRARNSSLILPMVLAEIAAQKGCSPETAEKVILENTLRFYGISLQDLKREDS